MKKTVICSIALRDGLKPNAYKSEDLSLPSSEKEYLYPVSSFLEKTLKSGDELDVIMIEKTGGEGDCRKNAKAFTDELNGVCALTGATASYREICTEFAETESVHKELLSKLTEMIETGNSIISDVTYGSKDVPILIFTALKFAEKYLGCSIENIIYGQAIFEGSIVKESYLRDLSPLYYLISVTDVLPETEPEKARELFRTMINL